MIDSTFEKHTERLVMRRYRASDFDMWRDTYSSLPQSKNRWDHGPKPIEKLTEAAFREVLAEQEKDVREDRFYRLNVFEKDSGQLIGQFSLWTFLAQCSKTAIWVIAFCLHSGEKGTVKKPALPRWMLRLIPSNFIG